MTEKVGGCHPRVVAGGCSGMHKQRPMPYQPPHQCHPMFANDPQKSMFILSPPKDLAVLLF
jgi:hypothetical protein